MLSFFKELSAQNPLLTYSGLICLILSIVLICISFFNHTIVLGINAWIKPIKFLLSICIFNWTMAWYLSFLPQARASAINTYSLMVVIVFTFELVIIIGQAARGQLSHFNVSTPVNGFLFQLMGIAITLLSVWTAVTATWFLKTPTPHGLGDGFWWGIRLGMILFVIFSFEGLVMGAKLQHTVGAPDGGKGLPILNWSRNNGDLRIAHFVGMHALQVIPLLGYFIFKRPAEIIAAAIFYGAFALWLFLRALSGKGLF